MLHLYRIRFNTFATVWAEVELRLVLAVIEITEQFFWVNLHAIGTA